MKHLSYVIPTLLLVLIVGCSPKQNDKQHEFKQIYIQYYPAFISASSMIFNISDSTVSFNRIGSKEILRFRPDNPSLSVDLAPKTFNFKLSDAAYGYLTDSISFAEADLVDCRKDVDDGKLTNIMFTKSNNEIIDMELQSCLTDNHKKLISKLIDESKEQTSDSVTLRYLTLLRSFYK